MSRHIRANIMRCGLPQASAELCVAHYLDYKLLDREFDAASDDMILWHACSGERADSKANV